jgi:phage-related protein (TIGR01555 family)
MTNTAFNDGLMNLAAGLGDPSRDKLAGLSWSAPAEQSDKVWIDMYRSHWLPKRIVDGPADDSTRNWRLWQAEAADISRIEAVENELQLSAKIADTFRLARLYGRAHLYFDIGDDPAEPLSLNRVRRGALRFATVLSRREVSDGLIQDDPMQPGYGYPSYYEISSPSQGLVRVHPSRMITLYGKSRPDDLVFGRKADSVLMDVKDSVTQYIATVRNVAQLTFEAKVDVWTVPGLNRILSDPDEEAAFLKAAQSANYMKGNYGLFMLEGGEGEDKTQYDQKKMSFATLPDVIAKMQEDVCAGYGYSKAYTFKYGAEGMGGNGNRDLSMDYDQIEQIQKNKLQPAMALFDEVLIRSALGSRPADVHYNWNSLWQESDNDKADRISKLAAAFKSISDAQMWPEDVLSETSINTMVETGGMPGLEAAWNEWREGNPDGDGFADDPDDMIEGEI